jgi:hypothetical protein
MGNSSKNFQFYLFGKHFNETKYFFMSLKFDENRRKILEELELDV